MVRIRLRRVGGKGQPSFRLVAAEKEAPRDGRFIENLGFYNPRTEPATIQLKEDRIFEWMQKGAQLSDAAEKVMRSAGALDRYARFKAGEEIEILLAEADAAEAARNINPKTTLAGGRAPSVEKAEEPAPVEKPAAKAKPVEKAEEEPVQESEAEIVEAEVETGEDETEAEAELEEEAKAEAEEATSVEAEIEGDEAEAAVEEEAGTEEEDEAAEETETAEDESQGEAESETEPEPEK